MLLRAFGNPIAMSRRLVGHRAAVQAQAAASGTHRSTATRTVGLCSEALSSAQYPAVSFEQG